MIDLNRLELLAPAGDMEKLKTAALYGADAVYFGGEDFSLRAGAGNFSVEEVERAVEFLHERDCRGYMTLNIYPHNADIEPLYGYIEKIRNIPIDAFLVSDPGVMSIIKDVIPDADIHLSTQANATNYLTAQFWARQGVSRVVAAREMSISELREMRSKLPDTVEIEAFVHGAMCISYSGRCLLSNFMAGKDANNGECTHPCRWKYSLVEQQRPGEYYPVFEDDRGSYIMNSRDLCMLDSLPDLIEAGVSSFKVEGRMKSSYYVATVISAYRAALDSYIENPAAYKYREEWFKELCKASHREFTHGFYYNKPTEGDHSYLSSDYTRSYSFVAVVRDHDEESGLTTVEQRNKFSVGDTIEIFGPRSEYYTETITEMYDDEGEPIAAAPHPQQTVKLRLKKAPGISYMMRKKL